MSNEVTLLTEGIGKFIGSLAGQARDRLTVVAPFIKRKALERLVSEVGNTISLTVITRWSVDEICAGVSDLEVFDFLRERPGSRMLLHPRLHAKVLLVDDATAVIGSANVSDAALGFSEQSNAEVMAVLRPVPNRLFLFLLRLERECVPATEELRRQFEEAENTVSRPTSYPTIEMPVASIQAPVAPFPRFRNPEGLYRGYVSVVEFSDHETRAAVLDDLLVLALPDGLDEPRFRSGVGVALLADGFVSAFDRFVAQPRYFGEMADWLKRSGLLPDADHEDRNLYLQSLIRWLRHFLPCRYQLQEPGYSELFGRIEGWDTGGQPDQR